MKQFNLKEYLKNPLRKVVTRDGRNARIVCIDRKGFNPILALVTRHDINIEDIYLYTENGELSEGNSTKSSLFFAPEKHEGWVNLYRDTRNVTYVGSMYTSEKEARENIYCPPRYVTTIKIEWEE